MGTILEWFQGKKLAITLAVVLVIGLVVAGLATYRLPYPVEAEGKMMPVEQYAVFAQADGKIEEILVVPDESGAIRVTEGQPLLQLKNSDIDDRITEAQGEFNKQVKLEVQTLNRRNNLVGDNIEEEEHRLTIELERIDGDKQIARNQITRLQKRKEDELTIRAPATGIVPDFKRLDILVNRPVHAGDHLFDVMNDTGEWHLELLVMEKRMGHINSALAAKLKADEPPTLKGDFTMASEAEMKVPCHLTQIATRSTVDGEIGTAFEMIAQAEDRAEIPTRQIGTEVTARFECEDCTLAFYLFGDVVEFVQRSLWWW